MDPPLRGRVVQRGAAVKASEKLRVTWSKREKDLMFHHPLGPQTKSDGHLLCGTFCYGHYRPNTGNDGPTFVMSTSFADEMRARGYDITTLRFEIAKDPNHPRWAK